MTKTICLCNQVTAKRVKTLITRHPTITLNEIIQLTGASSSCGRCRTELEAEVLKCQAENNLKGKYQQGLLPFPVTPVKRDK